MDLEKLNRRIEPDQLTGGTQTVYWNDEHTFMMIIPNKAIPIDENITEGIVEFTDNKDGTKSWKIKYENPHNKK